MKTNDTLLSGTADAQNPSGGEILKAFEQHGLQASVHYADDSTKEWAAGDAEKQKAIDLWKAHPELTEEMLKISQRFLWSFSLLVETTHAHRSQNS